MDFYTYRQMSAQELQEKARKSAEKASKKGRSYEPVFVQGKGRSLCTTWWGQSWCENLERYADYSNRLPRGKRYVRNGALLDLKIEKGTVRARVQGSRARPYMVKAQIDPMPGKKLEAILEEAGRKVSSLEALAKGEFPDELRQALYQKGGIFPSPDEIHFDCSCPDWASMCKHVACVMYGIGVRLDENPFYFFELRGIDTSTLIRQTVENKISALLENADRPSRRILDSKTAERLFSLSEEAF